MKHSIKNKVLVSGGWGYNNLGDDAILLATLQLIEDSIDYPEITVSTFNPIDTKHIIDKRYKTIASAHKLLFNIEPETIIFSSNLTKTKREKIWNKILLVCAFVNIPFLLVFYKVFAPKSYKTMNAMFEDADIFIQAGGGYFNSWRNSLIARSVELELAKKNKLETIVIGQSIGPFKKTSYSNMAQQALSKADAICVRDVESHKELGQMKLPSLMNEIIPDLALYEYFNLKKKNNLIIVIFNEQILKKKEIIKKAVKKANQEKKYDEIVITVSQLWKHTIEFAENIHHYLTMDNVFDGTPVNLYIPSNYNDFSTLINTSSYIISQNLHPLIMGWRADSNIICLNTDRKFKTFMDIVELPENLIPVHELTEENLYSKLINLDLNKNYNRNNISKKLKSDIHSIFKQATTLL